MPPPHVVGWRPVSLKRLSYDRDSGRVLYRMIKRRPGDPDVFRWTPLAFIKRLAPIIAPPRLNLVRYVGALGPRAKLRTHVTAAAREAVAYVELLRGVKAPVSRLAASVRKASTAASRAWASCLKKIFAHERQRTFLGRSVQRAAAR